MTTLKEKKILVRMQKAMGEPVDGKLLEEIASEEAELQTISESRKSAFQTIFADLSKDISQLIADEKKKTLEEEQLLGRFANVLTKIDEIKETQPETIIDDEPLPESIVEEVIVEKTAILAPPETPSLAAIAAKQIKAEAPSSMFVQPDPPLVSRDIKDIQQKLKLLEGWVSKIAMTGPGGGAGDVVNLDHQTTLVTTPTYTIGRKDYYVGINYAGTVTITLPTNIKNGRYIILKDESGRCSRFPIIVHGNVDNDPDGFILRVDNGGIQIIYRDGWRIV